MVRLLPATTRIESSTDKTIVAAHSVGRELQLNIDVSITEHDSDPMRQKEPVVFAESITRLVSAT